MSLEQLEQYPIRGTLTLGTFPLSVCDEAASVVTARFERFVRDVTALLLKGRTLAGLRARLNIVSPGISSVQLNSGEWGAYRSCSMLRSYLLPYRR